MLNNYFRIALRNLMKHKTFSLINILGLTIGIAVCMMIFLFIMNEFNVDNFHKDRDRIYRVMRGFTKDEQQKSVSYLSGMYAAALQNDFKGQVESVVRVNQNDNLIIINNRSFHEKKTIDADSNFFSFFSFPLLKGNPRTVLQDPHSLVLTETTAKKYFGSIDDAFGKTVLLDKDIPLKVTGIAKDIPSNSHLDFELVIPLSNYQDRTWMTSWINNGIYTYVKLAPNITKSQVEKQFPGFIEKYLGNDLRKYGFHWTLSLTPLKDIYFETPAEFGGVVKHGDKTVVYIFLSIAILILLIACINFMNLSTIRAAERSKEVGLRKVLGARTEDILKLLTLTFVKRIAIAFILAAPVAYYLMQRWLENFFYKISLSAMLFVVTAALVLVVAVITLSFQTMKAAFTNPVEELKNE